MNSKSRRFKKVEHPGYSISNYSNPGVDTCQCLLIKGIETMNESTSELKDKYWALDIQIQDHMKRDDLSLSSQRRRQVLIQDQYIVLGKIRMTYGKPEITESEFLSAFEKWAQKENLSLTTYKIGNMDMYSSIHTAGAWTMWKAIRIDLA